MKRAPRQGFTLLEVLVATTIMAVAVGTLLAALSTSVRNARRVMDSDRAATLAKIKMDELLVDPALTVGRFEGVWDPSVYGLRGGWRARVDPFENRPGIPDRIGGVYRVAVEIWWLDGAGRRTFLLEGYRRIMRNQ